MKTLARFIAEKNKDANSGVYSIGEKRIVKKIRWGGNTPEVWINVKRRHNLTIFNRLGIESYEMRRRLMKEFHQRWWEGVYGIFKSSFLSVRKEGEQDGWMVITIDLGEGTQTLIDYTRYIYVKNPSAREFADFTRGYKSYYSVPLADEKLAKQVERELKTKIMLVKDILKKDFVEDLISAIAEGYYNGE